VPLETDDIEEARAAYAALEETLAEVRQRVASLETERIELLERLQQLERSRTELPLAGLIGDLGLAATLGEAAMPGRVIGKLSATVRAFVQPDGEGVGVRLPVPELTGSTPTSTLSFVLAKVPDAGDGTAAPRSVYVVLEDKAAVYHRDAFREVDAAHDVIAEVARALSRAGGWTFEELADTASRIARREAQVARAVAGRSRQPKALEFRAATAALADRATSTARAGRRPVAGDVAALSARLDATTQAAAAFTR
jgi:hypothetical protein